MHAAVFKCVQRIKKVLVLGTSEHVKIKVKFNKILIAGEPFPNLDLSVPDRRRIGHVNAICMYIVILHWREGGQWRGGCPKMGQLALSKGPLPALI